MNWLQDLVWRYPETTRYLIFVAILAYLVYLLDKVI